MEKKKFLEEWNEKAKLVFYDDPDNEKKKLEVMKDIGIEKEENPIKIRIGFLNYLLNMESERDNVKFLFNDRKFMSQLIGLKQEDESLTQEKRKIGEYEVDNSYENVDKKRRDVRSVFTNKRNEVEKTDDGSMYTNPKVFMKLLLTPVNDGLGLERTCIEEYMKLYNSAINKILKTEPLIPVLLQFLRSRSFLESEKPIIVEIKKGFDIPEVRPKGSKGWGWSR